MQIKKEFKLRNLKSSPSVPRGPEQVLPLHDNYLLTDGLFILWRAYEMV